MRVLKDIHQESRGSKYSSKKVWGSIMLILVCLTYVVDGFDFYVIDHTLFNYMLITGAALVGMNTVREIASSFTKPQAPVQEPEPEEKPTKPGHEQSIRG